MPNILEILRSHALADADRKAFTLLVDGETIEKSLTYGELEQRALAVAAALGPLVAQEDRILIAQPDGLEFLSSFLGALYVGAIAVPIKLATNGKHLASTVGIARDCEAKLVIGSGAALARMKRLWEADAEPPQMVWVDSETICSNDAPPLDPPSDDGMLAYLQYTSGSTRAARGVMVSHRNLISNLARVQESVRQTRESCSVQWLPLYHDMGLTSLLFALYVGFPSVILSSTQFLQRPVRWLQAISHYCATLSGGPNFAYQLCAERIPPNDRAKLDLSTWQTAYCGAEPVRESTYRQFLAAFGPHGFGHSTFSPCYGLAEYVAAATAQNFGDMVRFIDLDAAALRSGQVELRERAPHVVDVAMTNGQNGGNAASNDSLSKATSPRRNNIDGAATTTIADCGGAGSEDRLLIVDPETCRPCAERDLGEIWLTGPSLTRGYWNRAEENAERFAAKLHDVAGQYLRTGDLGFLHEGRLFVTGRMKDLIIIRGANYYPQDIEHVVECSHSAVRMGGVAGFAVECDGVEALAVVAELEDAKQVSECERIFAAIREAIADQHDLMPVQIALLKPNSLPKTTSGKVQRQACRTALLDGSLPIAASWHAPKIEEHGPDGETGPVIVRTLIEIEAWLTARIARRVGLNAAEIDPDLPFARYGIDSASAVRIAGDLEQWLGKRLSPTLLYECRTVRILARRLHAGVDVAVSSEPVTDKAHADEPIAIVGLACQFAGAPNAEAFWRLIASAEEGIIPIPKDRWDVERLYDPDGEIPGTIITRRGGFLPDIDQFDAGFFGISPREAARMDPQQRMLLQTAWEAMEDAGIPADRLAGTRVGTFVGVGATDYAQVYRQHPDYLRIIDAYSGTGAALSIVANRLAYVFDFRGPSMAVDTACSSASVALHLAVRALRNGECDAALACGVNAILSPEASIAFSRAHMLSPAGECRSFDADAAGYARAEGCGVVLLKRLRDAVAAGDRILALVRGTAVNQDGRTTGITAPSPAAQQACIEAALRDGGIPVDQLSYIEAHGTGTPLGDPIEVQALSGALSKRDRRLPAVRFGSVKANIGHTETASGIAGLIKVCLMLREGVIPPQRNFVRLNPHIQLSTDGPLSITAEASPWPAAGAARAAGVSSFGFGGTNAHIVVEEWLQPVAAPLPLEDRSLHLLTLSTHTESALKSTAERYINLLSQAGAPRFADVAYSSHVTRSALPQRLSIVASDAADAVGKLQKFLAGEKANEIIAGRRADRHVSKIALLFTGQGSQYVGMGKRLYKTEPVYRAALDACDQLLVGELPKPLLSVIFADPLGDDGNLIHRTLYTQPALFALQYALTQLWGSWGIKPEVVMGHSIGEFAAAVAAGAMPWDDALRLVACRARLMDALPSAGAMLVVLASEEQVREAAEPWAAQLDVAALNGPENVVLSGPIDIMDMVQEECTVRGYLVQKLSVSHAFHSRLIEPMLDEFERFADTLTYQTPTTTLVSNVLGRAFEGNERPSGRYWRDHTRGTVRFAAGMRAAEKLGVEAFIEIGPTPTLLNMGRRCLSGQKALLVPSLDRERDDQLVLLIAVGMLFTGGIAVDWVGFEGSRVRRRVALPTSVFERTRVWFEPFGDRRHSVSLSVTWGSRSSHPLLGSAVPTALATTLYGNSLGLHTAPYLKDHVVQGSIVVPAAAYLEMAAKAAADAFGAGAHAVEQVAFQQVMFLQDSDGQDVQTTVAQEVQGQSSFQVFSLPAGEKAAWMLHASGTLRHARTIAAEVPGPVDVAAAQDRCAESIASAELYRGMEERGLRYGPRFRGVRQLHRTSGEALARLQLPEALEHDVEKYVVHPALLDAAFHVVGAALPDTRSAALGTRDCFLPAAVDQLIVYDKPGREVWARATVNEDADADPDEIVGNVELLDDAGRVLVSVHCLRLRRFSRSAVLRPTERLERWGYEIRWPEAPVLPAVETSSGVWWILADAHGVGSSLAVRLQAAGGMCRLFALKSPSNAASNGSHSNGASTLVAETLDIDDAEALRSRLAAESSLAGVVDLWNLDALGDAEPKSPSAFDPELDARLGSLSALPLVQALAMRSGKSARVWFVTRGAQPAGEEASRSLAGGALWGFGRVAACEHAELRPTLIDLDPSADDGDAVTALTSELLAADAEPQIAWRAGKRRVARLERVVVAQSEAETSASDGRKLSIPAQDPYRISIGAAGTLDGLIAKPLARQTPVGEQVEIEVAAAGLNFSDVLKLMGLYPGLDGGPVPLGIECSGTVTAVGPDVRHLSVGQEVVAVAPFSFGSHTTTAAYAVTGKPENLTHVQAATIPIAYLTAYYAIVRLADIQPGERVLIHAAAGGVGLAAVQIVLQAGGIVYATAGSSDKREHLRSLGVEHVFDSRDADFDEAVRAATNREGIDICLNSLPGEAIPKSIGLLRAYGRFLEIGKIDIYRNKQIGLYPFHNNLSYFAIDLDRLLRQRPDYVRKMFGEMMDLFAAGKYGALPATVFAAADASAAFRYMQQRKNTGKIIITTKPAAEAMPSTANAGPTVRNDASYLITGGLGAIGVLTAKRLAARGAKSLWLVGRSAPKGKAQAELDALRAVGVDVKLLQADVADYQQLSSAMTGAAQKSPPLRGVFHAAGVLDDGLIRALDRERMQKVADPKVRGAWNLHRLTCDLPLDYFVCYSSVAAVFGNPGQANYAAANAWLDSFAHARRKQGSTALSINWGPWAEGGMAGDEAKRLAARGMTSLAPAAALDVADELATRGFAQAAVMDADWSLLIKAYPQGFPPLLGAFADGASTPQDAGGDVLRRQVLAAPVGERVDMLAASFRARLARVMEVEPAKIELDVPLNAMGLDSLMAIELKNAIERSLRITLPIARFLEGPSLRKLAQYALEAIDAGAASNAGPMTAEESATDVVKHSFAVVDLDSEAVLDPGFRYAGPVLPEWSAAPQRILLTGGTGFLGAHMLADLLHETDAAIVCIVRAGDAEQGRERLLNNLRKHKLLEEEGAVKRVAERIEAVVGDLALPQWGLGDDEWRRLAGAVDRVYHGGAAVHFTRPYADLKAANVDGVREALRFALAERVKPLHYISSLGIFTSADYGERVIHEDGIVETPERLDGGYVQSKWVADRIVAGAMRAGMPISIYRLGLLTGDTIHGMDDADGLIIRMVKSVVQLGAAPLTNVQVECTPVDYVAQAVVRLSLDQKSPGHAFHLANIHMVPWNQVVDWLIELGFEIRKIPYDAWKSLLLSDALQSSDNAMSPLVPLLQASVGQEAMWMSANGSLTFATDNVDAGLAGTGIVCPKFDRDLLAKYVDYSLRNALSSSSGA
jgi:phthiocerol/phenolphthiocerol synthesis type-I polyketide synthase C